MRDEGTAKLLEDKVKKQDEWYQSKFKEIKFLKESIEKTTEDKKTCTFKIETNPLAKTVSLPQFITLKKTLMKMEKNHRIFEKEKNVDESHSFIFKKIKNLEDKQRLSENIRLYE